MDKLISLLDPKDVAKLIVLAFVAAGLWYGIKYELELIHRDLEDIKAEIVSLEQEDVTSEREIDDLKICCAANRIEIRTMGK